MSNIIQTFPTGAGGAEFPPGGTTGQALIKNSNQDQDVTWGDVDALPSGGTQGQALIKQSSSDGDADWEDIDALPSGGTQGQVLTKKSAQDGDAEWSDSLSLGETDVTAYAGDKGKANADHIGDLTSLETASKSDLVSAVNSVHNEIPQIESLPVASADLVGRIYQYTGATDATYTNGFYYKCTEDTGTSPSTYSWANVKVQAGTVSRDLLKVEYDALTEAEKTDGTVYYITDVSPVNPELQNYGFTPIGTIISVMGNSAPKNYLKCDGTEYPIDVFMDLALYFEQQFGSKNYFGGDGTTTFAVPDLQGEFLRGTGTNSHTNQGSGANVGVHQDATIHPNVCIDPGSTRLYVPTPKPYVPEATKLDSEPSTWGSGTAKAGRLYFTAGGSDTHTVSSGGTLMTSRPTNTSVLYCIAYKNVFIESIESQNVYSENEKVVGQWIDGKPLYQKTVDCGAIPNATSKEIAHNISDLDMIIDIKGFAYSSTDGWISLPFTVSSSTSNYAVQVDVRKNNVIKVQCAANMSAFTSSYVTLQYTKTID